MENYTFKDLKNVETILKGQSGELWLFDNTPEGYRYKCYSEKTALMRRISSWEGCKKSAVYYRQNGVMITFDVIIPKRLVKRACRLLGISLKKDPKKIEAAKHLNGKRNVFKREFHDATLIKNRPQRNELSENVKYH